MDWIRAIILGILQGLTEFLPVSSSAHLKIADTFFGSRTEVWFEVFLHAGTLCAVLFALKSDLIRLFVEALKMAGDLFRNLRIMIRRDRGETDIRHLHVVRTNHRKLVMIILISQIPAGAAGFLLRKQADGLYGSLLLTALGLFLTAIVLLVSDQISGNDTLPKDIPDSKAWIFALAQLLALAPGVSQTGMLLAAGLFAGLNKRNAVRLAYLISLPLQFGALICEIIYAASHPEIPAETILASLLGMLTAFLAGVLLIRRIYRLIRHRHMRVFAFYSALLGIAGLILHFLYRV